MAPLSPVSPPLSPRQSDISFTSVATQASAPPRKPSPPPTRIPVHASTSTISRDSRASNDDRPLTSASSRHFLESPSATRLPKARVFLHRHTRPDRPKPLSTQSGAIPPRTYTPTSPAAPAAPPRRPGCAAHEKRCVSDLQHAFRTNRSARPHDAPDPAPEQWRPRRDPLLSAEDLDAVLVGSAQHVPTWIPNDELENWTPAPEYDPCAVEEGSSSRWAASLRNLSNLHRMRDRNPPCIRGSILEVQPPTLTERFGLGALGGDRRYANRDNRGRQPGRARLHKRSKARQMSEMVPKSTPIGMEDVADENEINTFRGLGKDDYVGFLVESQQDRPPRPRRSWLRFLRRSRA